MVSIAVKTGLNENKWGYIDRTGKEIILPKYEEITPFSNGFAVVTIKDPNPRILLLNKQGKNIAKEQVYKVKRLSEGHLAIELSSGNWGAINKKGDLVVPANMRTLAISRVAL